MSNNSKYTGKKNSKTDTPQIVIDQIKLKHKISDYLAERGINARMRTNSNMVYHCPLPSHPNDNSPSFYIYDKEDYEDFYCYGCIGESELIWTQKGLVPIKNVSVGDSVIGIYGEPSVISDISCKRKIANKLRLGSFRDPLEITDDHICLYLPKEKAISALPYIINRSDKNKLDYRYSSKNRILSSYGDKILLTAAECREVKEGDFFVFPVIDSDFRNAKQLYSEKAKRNYSKGPKVKRIKLKATESLAFVYGLYLAEGSISGRTVRFTMNIAESDILTKVQSILKEELDLDSTIQLVFEKNVSELVCSSVDFADQISYYFGKGCDQKQIPFEVLYWKECIQDAIMQGYLTGDGNASKTSSTSTSQKLTYGLYALGIQCGYLPVVSDRVVSKQRDGSKSKDHWIITYRKREGLNAFYEFIGEKKYFFSRVHSIEKQSEKITVYDIGVNRVDSFVTKLGLVHNCKSGGSIVHFVAEYENLGLRQVVERLSEGIGINVEDIMDALILEITSDSDKPSPREALELAFCLNKSLHDYLKAVNFEPAEVAIAEKAGRIIEKYLYAENIKGLKDLFDDSNPEGLGYHIRNRVNYFNCRKQEEEIERLRRNVSGGQDGRTSQEILREHGRDKGS